MTRTHWFLMVTVTILAGLLVLCLTVAFGLTVKWSDTINPPAHVAGYRVEQAPGPLGTASPWTTVATVGPGTTQAQFEATLEGETCWRVIALGTSLALDSLPSAPLCKWVLYPPAEVIILPTPRPGS